MVPITYSELCIFLPFVRVNPQIHPIMLILSNYSTCSTFVSIGATRRIRLNLCFVLLIRAHNANDKLIGSAIFAQLTAHCRYTLQPAAPFPLLKIARSHAGSGPHLAHDSRGPSEPKPKRYLDRFSRFCSDRQTDKPRYSVCNNTLHLRT